MASYRKNTCRILLMESWTRLCWLHEEEMDQSDQPDSSLRYYPVYHYNTLQYNTNSLGKEQQLCSQRGCTKAMLQHCSQKSCLECCTNESCLQHMMMRCANEGCVEEQNMKCILLFCKHCCTDMSCRMHNEKLQCEYDICSSRRVPGCTTLFCIRHCDMFCTQMGCPRARGPSECAKVGCLNMADFNCPEDSCSSCCSGEICKDPLHKIYRNRKDRKQQILQEESVAENPPLDSGEGPFTVISCREEIISQSENTIQAEVAENGSLSSPKDTNFSTFRDLVTLWSWDFCRKVP